MRSVFSSYARQRLEEMAKGGVVYTFDFDGTLAPIRTRPGQARLPRSTARLLDQLAAMAPVAIVSGRGLADLRQRAVVKGARYVGNHGLEGVRIAEHRLNRAKKLTENWAEWFDHAVSDDDSIEVERKGVSLSVHYRRHRQPARARRRVLRLASRLDPEPRLLEGKAVLNILPPGAPHKGDAVRALLRICDRPYGVFIGDDTTDEDVFREKNPSLFTVRVGEDRSAAGFRLRAREDIDRLLRLLVEVEESKRGVLRGKSSSRRTNLPRSSTKKSSSGRERVLLKTSKRSKRSAKRPTSSGKSRSSERRNPKAPKGVRMPHRKAKDVKRSVVEKGPPAAGKNARGKKAKASKSGTNKFQPLKPRKKPTTSVSASR